VGNFTTHAFNVYTRLKRYENYNEQPMGCGARVPGRTAKHFLW